MSIFRCMGVILQSLVTLFCLHNFVFADVFLTSENLNSSLKQMQRSQLQIQNKEGYEDALYALGKTADDLASLLTDEVKAHGDENEKLIELALDRTEQIEVDISWVRQNQAFYYDGEALYEYLGLYPDGQYTMDVGYRVIKRDFFLVPAEDESDLLEAIDNKKNFIAKFPDFENLSEIELYLAIDYRDLWRHYRNKKMDDLAKAAADNTGKQLEHIIQKYMQDDEGEIARRLLQRFREETAL